MMGTRGIGMIQTRCTMKISFTAGQNTAMDCMKAIKDLFKQLKRFGDKKIAIAPWYDHDEDSPNIIDSNLFPTDTSEFNNYFPRFYVRKGEGYRTECVQMNPVHAESVIDVKKRS